MVFFRSKVRFVTVHKSEEGDRRSTTFARVEMFDTFDTFEKIIIDGSNWQSNISIRPWIYLPNILWI